MWSQSLPGFFLGLVSAVLLAMFINPWVARRAERRSRWLDRAQQAIENLTWEVEPALKASRQLAMTTIPIRNEYRQSNVTEVLELLDKWTQAEQVQFELLSTSIKRTTTLMRYVCYTRPHSDALSSLDMQWKRVELYLRGIDIVRLDVTTTQDTVLSSYKDAQEGLTHTIQMLEKMVFSGGQPRRSVREMLRRTRRTRVS